MPRGERIKKKVIDIHFNPQLPICHSIFTTKNTESFTVGHEASDESGQRGAEKEEEEKKTIKEK